MRNAVINMVIPTALILILAGMQLIRLHNQTVDRGRASNQLRLLHPRKLLKAFILPITLSLFSLSPNCPYTRSTSGPDKSQPRPAQKASTPTC